jgi:hypothetical protein
MKWFSVDANGVKKELVLAKSSDRDQDYYNSKFNFTFFKGQPSVYGELSSKAYPDLVIKTDYFAVGKENILVGVENVKAEELSITISQGALVLQSGTPMPVNVYSTDGKLVWKGEVDVNPLTVSLPKGIYLVNGKKVLL